VPSIPTKSRPGWTGDHVEHGSIALQRLRWEGKESTGETGLTQCMEIDHRRPGTERVLKSQLGSMRSGKIKVAKV
jgi:hypothetical protein